MALFSDPESQFFQRSRANHKRPPKATANPESTHLHNPTQPQFHTHPTPGSQSSPVAQKVRIRSARCGERRKGTLPREAADNSPVWRSVARVRVRRPKAQALAFQTAPGPVWSSLAGGSCPNGQGGWRPVLSKQNLKCPILQLLEI